MFVEFDGVMQNSDVWINGFPLGHRPNGYVSFRYELTPHLNFRGGNVLAVRADTSAQPASRWYSGGGIYRHVRLVVTDPVHFWPGRGLCHHSANFRERGDGTNPNDRYQPIRHGPEIITVQTSLVAPDGKHCRDG